MSHSLNSLGTINCFAVRKEIDVLFSKTILFAALSVFATNEDFARHFLNVEADRFAPNAFAKTALINSNFVNGRIKL